MGPRPLLDFNGESKNVYICRGLNPVSFSQYCAIRERLFHILRQAVYCDVYSPSFYFFRASTGTRRESHLFYRYTQRFATFAGTCRGSRHLLVYVEGLQSAYFIFSMRLSFQIFYILLSKSVGYSFGSLLLCSSLTGHFGLCLIPQLYVPIPSQLC